MKRLDTFFTFALVFGIVLGLPFVTSAAAVVSPGSSGTISDFSVIGVSDATLFMLTCNPADQCLVGRDFEVSSATIPIGIDRGSPQEDYIAQGYGTWTLVELSESDPCVEDVYCTLEDARLYGSYIGEVTFTFTAPSTPSSALFSVPTSTASNLTAQISDTFAGSGFLGIVITVISLPLVFYVIHRLLGILKREHEKKNGYITGKNPNV